jgi:hypothetical protein
MLSNKNIIINFLKGKNHYHMKDKEISLVYTTKEVVLILSIMNLELFISEYWNKLCIDLLESSIITI